MNFRFDRYMQNLDIADNYIASLDKTSLRELGVISLVQLNASRKNIYDVEEEAFLEQKICTEWTSPATISRLSNRRTS